MASYYVDCPLFATQTISLKAELTAQAKLKWSANLLREIERVVDIYLRSQGDSEQLGLDEEVE
jgi:hypothetical protein